MTARLSGPARLALLRHDRHRPGARPGRPRAGGRRRRPDPGRRRAARRSSRCSPAVFRRSRGSRAGLSLIAAGAVATYQLSFFAAVADTGVAVGTIVALGSAPALAGAIEWAVERRAPERAWAMATALACAGVAMLALAGADAIDLAPRRRASRSSPAPPTRATRSPPSGC